MFESIKARMYIAKVQAELKAQCGDQAFVNRVCQLPENLKQLGMLREQAYYRKDRIAPFLNACHVLGESMNSGLLSKKDREACASLLRQRLQKVSEDTQFRLRHIMIFSDLEEKIDRFEQEEYLEQVNRYFQEGNALLVFVLITCREKNLEYFEDRFTLREKVTEMLDGGMSLSEAGNERAAYVHFREAIEYISKEHPLLIEQDGDLMDGVRRAMELENEKINPAWLSYKAKYLSE